jgi:hypothetical protein
LGIQLHGSLFKSHVRKTSNIWLKIQSEDIVAFAVVKIVQGWKIGNMNRMVETTMAWWQKHFFADTFKQYFPERLKHSQKRLKHYFSEAIEALSFISIRCERESYSIYQKRLNHDLSNAAENIIYQKRLTHVFLEAPPPWFFASN